MTTWRRVIQVLAVVLNLGLIGLWVFQLARLVLADHIGPEGRRTVLTEYSILIAVPALSLVALLWPPINPPSARDR